MDWATPISVRYIQSSQNKYLFSRFMWYIDNIICGTANKTVSVGRNNSLKGHFYIFTLDCLIRIIYIKSIRWIFLWRKWYYGIEWSFSGNEYRIQSDKQFSDLSGERDDCDKSSSCGSFEGFSKPEVLGIGTSSSVFTFLFFLYIIKWHLLHNISTITITFFKAFDHFSASSSLFTLSLCLDDFQNEELHPTHRECQALILKLYTYLLNVLKIY